MGKMLLILIVSSGMIFSIITLNINQSNSAMLTNSVSEYEGVTAKNNAASGIEIAVKSLSQDTAWSGINNSQLMQGSVTVNVQNTTSKYFNGPDDGLVSARLVTATGKMGNQTHVVRAVIQLPSGTSTKKVVPPFLKYAIAAGQNLQLTGNITVRDDFNPLWNANVHTNQNFQMNGNNTIKGFLTYVQNAQSTPGHRLKTSITPNVNPDNLPNHYKTPIIEIPDFEPEDYKHLATDIHNANYKVSGNFSLGTKDNPKIVYVGGNLDISGNVTGYGVFIVKGNTKITGNVNIITIDPTSSNLGIYSKGNIDVNGNVTLKAQLLGSQNINLGGNVKVYGSMTAKQNVNFNGNTQIYYRPANDNLTNPFWKTEGKGTGSLRPVILSYYE